jgi:hypothetical protein
MSFQLTRLFCMKVESTRAARRPYIHRGLGEADGRSPACRGMFRELKIKAEMFTIRLSLLFPHPRPVRLLHC